jgi:soluble cytochrome b562
MFVHSAITGILQRRYPKMKEEKQSQSARSGIPMSEEELKEWRQSFDDIQESIDKVMAEGEDI